MVRRAGVMPALGAVAAVRAVRPVLAPRLVLVMAAKRAIPAERVERATRVVPVGRVACATRVVPVDRVVLATLAGVAVIRAVAPTVAMSHAARGVAVAATNTVGPALSRAVRPAVALAVVLAAAPVDTRPPTSKVNPSASRRCWLVSVWRLAARLRTGFAPRASRLTARSPH